MAGSESEQLDGVWRRSLVAIGGGGVEQVRATSLATTFKLSCQLLQLACSDSRMPEQQQQLLDEQGVRWLELGWIDGWSLLIRIC